MSDCYWATIRIWPWPKDTAPIQAAVDWLTDQYGEIIVTAGEPQMLGALNLDPDGVLTLEVEEARGGVDEFLESEIDASGEHSLVDALREVGISFVFADEGDRVHQGREVSWRPGLNGLRERWVLQGGEIALPEELVKNVLTADNAADLLLTYFAPLEEFEALPA